MRAVLTCDDVPGRNLHGLVSIDWPVLCADKVLYAGDAIAIVAADSEEIAAQALELIRVEYEELPAVTSASMPFSLVRQSCTKAGPTETCSNTSRSKREM